MPYGQPSVNQIANLYQGNPNALAQKVATEPKGPTGLPRDLSKLMALNIDLTETDAAKRQAAMAGLQQMQQGQPEPPTVAQTIQQQAAEKAKALAVQAQRQQQGLQALMQNQGLMGAVPERTPQPERQPSGLDELRTNLGENYAGGGIVAFSGTGSSQFVRDISALPEAFDEMKQRAREEDARKAEQDRRMEQYRQDKLAAQQKTSLFNYLFGTPENEKEGLAKLAELSNAPVKTTAPTPASAGLDEESQKLARLAASRDQTGQSTNVALQPASVVAPTTTEQKRQTNIAVPTESGNKPAPSAPAAPAEKSLYDKWMEQALSQTPEARREAAINRYKEMIGAPDTAAQEKYIQQLEARRSQFAEPTDPYERFRQYARAAATAGGRTWQQTGAAASSALEQQRLANAQKDMEVLKELMGESSKLADIKRGYKKEAFAFGEKEYDDAYKYGFDAAKEMGLTGRQRELFAHQSAENALQRANALKVAGMPGAEERMFGQVAKDWLAKPENKGKSLADAYAAFKIMGSPAAGAKISGVMTLDQARDNVRKDLENMMTGPKMIKDASEALKALGIPNPTTLQINDYLVQQQMNKPAGGAPMGASGKVPALPSGFKLD